jgi:hypothetical protein
MKVPHSEIKAKLEEEKGRVAKRSRDEFLVQGWRSYLRPKFVPFSIGQGW